MAGNTHPVGADDAVLKAKYVDEQEDMDTDHS